MNRPHLALAALLLFSSYTAWTMAIADQSLLAFGLELLSRPDTAQVVIDLYLLGAMAGTWIYRDARARGYPWVSILPYLALTMVFLSIGPLLYIVMVGYRGQRRKALKARASDSAPL